MLKIVIPESEHFNEATSEFVSLPEVALELEHSLVSLSKWESKWEKPFLGSKDRTTEETYGYLEAMSLNPDLPPGVFYRLSQKNLSEVNEYINAKMTATWFSEATNGPRNREVITSELIYYWMVALTIPFECETWHLNRLITLIKVCNKKNSPQKKMSAAELAQRNRQLNEERKKKYNTKG